MTLETFFEKFELFADAPNAVDKMRELVLQLAVRGKLSVRQLSDQDNPAWITLKEEIDSRINSYDPGPPPPFAIPNEWYWVCLDDVADYRAATKIEPVNLHKDAWLLDLEEIEKGTGRFLETKTFCEKASRSTKAAFQKRDVLYGKLRPYLNKVAVAPREGFCTTEIVPIRSRGVIIPEYLAVYLRSPSFVQYASSRSYGMKMPRLGTADAERAQLSLPPPAEQKRIVAKVDELMALCDRLEAQQKEREARHAALARASLSRFAEAPTPASLNLLFHKSYHISPADLRKTILTLAVQGKLVPFDAIGEKKTVGDHVDFLNGYAFKSEWFKPSGIRLCRNVNVSHGILEWSDSAFVDSKLADEFERFRLSKGDIVLSLDRPLITTGLKVARVRKSDLPCLLLQRVAKPIPKHDELDLSYFFLWLNSPEFVESIDPGRSNGVPHISTRQIRSLPFALPPLAEQRRIAAKVDELMALVDQLETQLITSHTQSVKILESIVAELSDCTPTVP